MPLSHRFDSYGSYLPYQRGPPSPGPGFYSTAGEVMNHKSFNMMYN